MPSAKVTFNDVDDNKKEFTIAIQKFGRHGWQGNSMNEYGEIVGNWNTNEEGNGLWHNGQQVKGTTQYELPSNWKKALYKRAKSYLSFTAPYGYSNLKIKYSKR